MAKEKRIAWIDNSTEGKIDKDSLKILEAHSPTKKVIDTEIEALKKEGYTHIEAHALTGKSTSKYDEKMYQYPQFFDCPEKIIEEKQTRDLIDQQRKQARSKMPPGIDVPVDGSISFVFFSNTAAMVSLAAIGTAILVNACR